MREKMCFDPGYNNSEVFGIHTKDNANISDLIFGSTTMTFILFVHVLIAIGINANTSIFKLKLKLTPKDISRVIALTILMLVLPIITLFLLSAFIYKNVCLLIIRKRDKHFVKFLDSFDVFWCLEDDTSSIINVVGLIEAECSEVLVTDIKNKLLTIAKEGNQIGVEKLFYRRNEEFGFYYWRKYGQIDMNEYVQTVEHPLRTKLYKSDLEEIMSELSYKQLPHNNEGLFQILITKHKINDNNEDKDYGIIFRIHHSVGDGVALLEFLCKTLANDSKTVKMFPYTNSNKQRTVKDLLVMMKKLCEIPIAFVDGIIRKPDVNSLHGPNLTGIKIYKWRESDEALLKMIKDIKQKLGLHFSEVIAASLSKSLRSYFLKTMPQVPDTVAVIVPVRFPKNDKLDIEMRLENDFSVTTLDLPINGNIGEIKSKCDELRRSADPLSNYYFLRSVSAILPRRILQPLLHSTQATMVFSNMPGPDILRICGNNLLKSLVFFVPQKGTTGFGITALCYGGVLRLGINIDRALVSTNVEPTIILDELVNEIEKLHAELICGDDQICRISNNYDDLSDALLKLMSIQRKTTKKTKINVYSATK